MSEKTERFGKSLGIIGMGMGMGNDPAEGVYWACGSPFYAQALEIKAQEIEVSVEQNAIFEEKFDEIGGKPSKKEKEVKKKSRELRRKKAKMEREYLQWRASEERKSNSMAKSKKKKEEEEPEIKGMVIEVSEDSCKSAESPTFVDVPKRRVGVRPQPRTKNAPKR